MNKRLIIPLVAALLVASLPAWAQATPTIFFIRAVNGVNHIFSMSETGSNVRQITSGPYRDEYISFCKNPSNRIVTFYRYDQYGVSIYKMNPSGGGLTRLSKSIPSYDIKPSFTPDCTKILYQYQVQPDPPNVVTQIRTMNATDGSGVQAVFPAQPDQYYYLEPRYAPDGSKIVFMSNRDGIQGSNQCYTINPDGTGLQQLTFNPDVCGDPVWAPNSQKIIYASRDSGGNVNVFSMNPDGTGKTQLTHYTEAQGEAGDANVSSDASKITFEFCVNGNICQGQSNPNATAFVYTMNYNGTGIVSTNQRCASVGCGPRYQPQ